MNNCCAYDILSDMIWYYDIFHLLFTLPLIHMQFTDGFHEVKSSKLHQEPLIHSFIVQKKKKEKEGKKPNR